MVFFAFVFFKKTCFFFKKNTAQKKHVFFENFVGKPKIKDAATTTKLWLQVKKWIVLCCSLVFSPLSISFSSETVFGVQFLAHRLASW